MNLDRIDLHIDVQPVDFERMSSTADGEPSYANAWWLRAPFRICALLHTPMCIAMPR